MIPVKLWWLLLEFHFCFFVFSCLEAAVQARSAVYTECSTIMLQPFWLQAFDGCGDTHWFSRDGRCLYGRTAAHVWLEYCLPAHCGAVTLVRYRLTSARGRARNDPKAVVLYGVRTPCLSYLSTAGQWL